MMTPTAARYRLAELASVPYVAAEVEDALDRIILAVQPSGLDGSHEACVRLDRIRRALRKTVADLDRSVTAAVRAHEEGVAARCR